MTTARRRSSPLAARRCALVASVLALAGCATSAPRPLGDPVSIPDAWSPPGLATAPHGTPLADWWLRFNDPTLTRLLGEALAGNTTLRGAAASLKSARAERDIAAAALWPTLDASASVGIGSAAGQSTGRVVQAGLGATWVPDVFGARRHGLAAATAALEASGATLGDLQASIAAELATTYILLRSAQARLAIATANLSSQQETLQITLWRQQAGLVTELESAQARALAAQTAAAIPVLQTSIARSSHALAVLTGRSPAALAATLAIPAPVPSADEEVIASIPAEALRQRADVRAAESQVRGALARVSAAQAARWPAFTLQGSIGATGSSVAALTHRAASLASLLGGATLPIIDGGARRAEVRLQEAALEQARVTYVATVLAALIDVEDTLAAIAGDRERLVSLGIAATAAADAAALAGQRFRSGLVDFQTVLDTQRTQLGTQDGLAGALADVSTDEVHLFRALGGGWREGDLPGLVAGTAVPGVRP